MKNLLVVLIVCFPIIFTAQGNCGGSFTEYYLNSNHIKAAFYPRGNKFTEDGSSPGFFVPYPAIQQFSTIFASSLWIGGFDDAGNLKMASEKYPSSTQQDFNVGPLTSIGLPYDSICGQYDYAWTVYNEDIVAHRNDFIEDFKIDDTIPSIFGWPGRGNKFFKKYYGFELPNDNQGLAPFFDWNGNNMYDPENGDYPSVRLNPAHDDFIPDQILWMVFNDFDPSDSTGHRPLQYEIQLTAFAFHCQDNEILNNTIFNRYKIINRAVLALDSIFLGFWTDYDLGCSADDFVGSDSTRNTEYVYNSDPVDGDIGFDCNNGSPTYADHPPVQSMTYLDHPMHSFITAMSSNETDLERYRLLNGQWEDGTPIRESGDGYHESDPVSQTHFLFHGDPRDTASWSASKGFSAGSDFKTVSSVSLGRMDPGAIRYVTTAYMFHSDLDSSYLGHITLMNQNIDSLLSFFSDPIFPCSPVKACSGDDCVWPGDFDHNNIADHRDLLTWGVLKDLSGPERNGLVSWRGHYSDEWNEDLSGINAKHSDGDGSGKIDLNDITTNEDHFRFTNRFYQQHDIYPEGPEIVLSSIPMDVNGRIRSINVQAGTDLQNILGLAYEIDFDTSLYMIKQIRQRKCPADSNIVCFGTNDYAPEDPNLVVSPEYAFVKTDHQPIAFQEGYVFDRLAGGLWPKPNITLNDLPDTVIIRLKNLIALDPNGNDLHIGSNTLKIPNYLITGTKDPGTTESSVFLYPNPANQTISIETELESDILIFNSQGLVIKKINHADIHQPVDISALSPGLYILQLLETGEAYKFVKE